MKKKIGLLICGNSGVDYMDLDYPHKVIRSTLILNNKEYEDFVDITAEEFYDVVVKNPDIDLSTSQISTGKITEIYEEFKEEGYTDVIAIIISSKLSGTFQGAVLAKDLVDGINIHVVDSKSVSYGQYYLVLRAVEMIQEGFSALEIKANLEELREKINIYVLVDTLKYLVKNGRLSQASGVIGSLLKIKPLLKIVEDGSLIPHEKIRTTRRARKRLFDIIVSEIEGKNVEVFIAYTNNKDKAYEMKDDFLEVNPNLKISIVPLTPVVGAHAGPGTLGVGYIVID